LRLFAARNVIRIGTGEMMMVPVAKNRQPKMERPDSEGGGRDWR
jgi:hypothetical protein